MVKKQADEPKKVLVGSSASVCYEQLTLFALGAPTLGQATLQGQVSQQEASENKKKGGKRNE